MPQPVNAINAKPTIATIKIDLIAIFKDLVFIGSPLFWPIVFLTQPTDFFKMIGAANSRPSTGAFKRALGLLPAVAAFVGSIAHHRTPGHRTTAGFWIQFPHFDHMVNALLVELGL